MEPLKDYIQKRTLSYITFFKWLALAIVVGGIAGGAGTLFFYAISLATQLREAHGFLLYLLPLAGLLIVLLYRISKQGDILNTNMVLESIRSDHKLPLRMAPLIFIATVLTHLTGGSSGREGAALQLGGSLSTYIGKKLHLNENDMKVMTMCGMSAAFAALFRTPITAAVFAMEVVSVGVMYYVALIPCALAAIIGFALSGHFGVPATFYQVALTSDFQWPLIIKVLLLGILCAILSITFCKVLHRGGALYKQYISNEYLRVLAGSGFVILLTLLCHTRDYLGAGGQVIAAAINGQVHPEAFLLKMLFTALTLGAGYKGGEIVPSFFVGATFGAFIGPFLGLPSSFAASLGLIALFCGVTNCPITSFILSVEMFGGQAGIYFFLIIATSYMLSGYTGLYSEQKIMYSKIKPVFINTHAH